MKKTIMRQYKCDLRASERGENFYALKGHGIDTKFESHNKWAERVRDLLIPFLYGGWDSFTMTIEAVGKEVDEE